MNELLEEMGAKLDPNQTMLATFGQDSIYPIYLLKGLRIIALEDNYIVLNLKLNQKCIEFKTKEQLLKLLEILTI